jgi:hypothetical protein
MQLSAKSRLALYGVAISLVLSLAGVASADPCLVVYPDASCIYHYDTNEYYTVTPGDPLYDPAYDRGGEVLIDATTHTIDLSIYQAPNLVGFTPSVGGQDGYFFNVTNFTLFVDGFNNSPITYSNILLVFEPQPAACTPIVTVDGNPVLSHVTLGLYYPIGDLVVSTPTPDGMNYSDVLTFTIDWQLCQGMRIWAFADEDFDYTWTDSECFTAFSHDATVPAEETTWGAVKALYQNEE